MHTKGKFNVHIWQLTCVRYYEGKLLLLHYKIDRIGRRTNFCQFCILTQQIPVVRDVKHLLTALFVVPRQILAFYGDFYSQNLVKHWRANFHKHSQIFLFYYLLVRTHSGMHVCVRVYEYLVLNNVLAVHFGRTIHWQMSEYGMWRSSIFK